MIAQNRLVQDVHAFLASTGCSNWHKALRRSGEDCAVINPWSTLQLILKSLPEQFLPEYNNWK
jgi:hypothetical protein